jgi:outer membrane translocation and assembly module TamA
LNYRTVAIFGSLAYVNYRFQVDFPLSAGLKIGPFLDAANLLQDRFSFGQLRWGSGFGLHYPTPIGSINLDWGYDLFPLPSDSWNRNQFYFSIGVI